MRTLALFLPAAAVVLLLAHGTAGQSDCPGPTKPYNASAYQAYPIHAGLVTWQGLVLIVCFGVFALFIALVHRLIRACIYYDNQMLDTFFDAGGDVNFALIACAIVARWLWTASFTSSTASVALLGLVGQFWYAAAGAVPLLIFSIVVSEIRIKAPGAKTFLQVIYARFGAGPQILVMIFALIVNIIIAGMVMMEGTRILTSLTAGTSKEAVCILLTVAVGVFTVVGGVGGGIYFSFFACALVISIMLVYFVQVFFPHGSNAPFPNGAWDVYVQACGVPVPADNNDWSTMTFWSQDGVLGAIAIVLCGFTSVFVNQSFWSAAVSSKPIHAVWGYLTGALAWFGIPFMLSFTFGMTYWAMAASAGGPMVSISQLELGYLPVIVSQRLMGTNGDFMMYSLTLAVVLTACSSEILSISSIIVYDIYIEHINPFVPRALGQSCCTPTLVCCGPIDSGDFNAYNRRCVIVQYIVASLVSLLLFPLTLILLAIGIDLSWLFFFLGVLCGSCVLPISLSVAWHRTTGAGVISGVVTGTVCALVAWLVYASTFPGGLQLFRLNTGRPEVFVVGAAVALVISGLVCVFVSVACGGCDPNRGEGEEWEKTRAIDNPAVPWAVRYAPDCGVASNVQPSYYTLRRMFRCAEVSAYVFGILLAVGGLFVWAPLMLIAGEFSYQTFDNWMWLVLIWGVCAGIMLCLAPLLYELLSLCCQAAKNRAWVQGGDRRALVTVVRDDDVVAQPPPVRNLVQTARIIRNVRELTPVGNDYTTAGTRYAASTYARPMSGERWQTFIKLN